MQYNTLLNSNLNNNLTIKSWILLCCYNKIHDDDDETYTSEVKNIFDPSDKLSLGYSQIP